MTFRSNLLHLIIGYCSQTAFLWLFTVHFQTDFLICCTVSFISWECLTQPQICTSCCRIEGEENIIHIPAPQYRNPDCFLLSGDLSQQLQDLSQRPSIKHLDSCPPQHSHRFLFLFLFSGIRSKNFWDTPWKNLWSYIGKILVHNFHNWPFNLAPICCLIFWHDWAFVLRRQVIVSQQYQPLWLYLLFWTAEDDLWG